MKQDYLFTKDHEWVDEQDGVCAVGLTDFAQEELGDIVYVEMPELGDVVEKGDSIASVESVKAASDVFAPVSGEIIEVNEDLEDDPGLLNAEPYDTWVCKIQAEDKSELSDLMSDKEYEDFIS